MIYTFHIQVIDVWYRAASQILLSLSLGLGSQFALCSFNNFKNNTIRDAILIACCNSLTSIYAGFTVFAIMGFLAFETGTTVDKV
jgi:SNF family Na+-dependent transporter